MIISTDIDFFDTVYLKTDLDQLPRTVLEVKVMPKNLLLYALSHSTIVSWHYCEEFSKEKDEVKIIQ